MNHCPRVYNKVEMPAPLTAKSLYIFDFDGVLTDSVDVKTQAFAEIYRSYGTQVVEQVIAHHAINGGMSRTNKFKYYHKKFLGLQITLDEIEYLSEIFSGLVVEKIIKSDEVEGVSNILEYCKHKNFICTITSATPEDELRKIVELRGWTELFKFVYGSPESKVDNIEKTLRVTSLSKSEAIFFGDSINDYIAAKVSNIDFIGINFSLKKDDDFPRFKDFTELLNFVDQY
jgi:phosphoglycolate phosphatase-like HAD superfamily hydrolase